MLANFTRFQTALRRTVVAQLPIWAQPDYVVLRYVRRRTFQQPFRLRLITLLLAISVVVVLALFSYNLAHRNTPLAMNGPRDSLLFTTLYFPLLILQWLVLALALLSTSGLLATERARGTWEAFKITSHGAESVIRARWAALFYQLRWLLAVLVGVRVLFAVMMLADLADYQGYHLDLYVSGVRPQVSLDVAVLLLAAQMTASLLIMLVLVGLNAAVGLTLSALFVQRTPMNLARVFIFAAQIALVAGSFETGHHLLDGFDPFAQSPTISAAERFGSLLAFGILGDQGLMFMDLETFLQTWTDSDYAVLLGAASLGMLLLLAVLTNTMLLWAARRAARPERE